MPIEKKCTVCGKIMFVKPCLVERKKYCSKECAKVGWKGQRRARASEFKAGTVPTNKMPVGTVTIRTSKKDGRQMKWIKIEEPAKWVVFCRHLWQKSYGPIPQGLLIHHIDRDPLNDQLSNLALVTRASHLIEHRPELEDKRLESLRGKNGK